MISKLGWRWSWMAVVALFALSGCQKEVPPTRFEASLVAAADLNPTVDGRPAPLLVRLYPSPSSKHVCQSARVVSFPVRSLTQIL